VTGGPAGPDVGAGSAAPGGPIPAGAAAAGSRAAGRLVVFAGPPGAGKTTVGRLLAARWSVGFRDTDGDVEAVAGMSVADVFVEHGEAHFRALEAAAVRAALAGHAGVLTLGGGAVMDPATRAELAGHTVVHLDVGMPDAVRRVGLARDRPLLVEAPRARLAAMLAERRPLYAEVATVAVDTSGRTPEQVADEVERLLGESGRPPAPTAGRSASGR
jgi:shikimate kinase